MEVMCELRDTCKKYGDACTECSNNYSDEYIEDVEDE